MSVEREVLEGCAPRGVRAAREVVAEKDARTLADDVLAMDDEAFRAAFRKSAMKRAKVVGLQSNAVATLETVGKRSGMTISK
jgi:hypothetical protein